MTPFAIVGTALWALAGLALLPFADTLATDGHTWWLWTCVAGFASGLVGTAFMVRHDRRHQLAAAGPDPTPDGAGRH